MKKISVIIPIYNVEEYLEETIESVINQTIGFEENIELILINDGSPDNSEEICLKYKEKFPKNITYVKQKNAGVSAARNKGIELAKGELTTLLDSDDKWSEDAFKEAYKYYKKYPHIKIFTSKMLYFEAQTGNHPLNYKYKNNKIVNIEEDFSYCQLHSASAFFETKTLKKYRYSKEIKLSEDNKFINEIIFDEKKYMVMKNPIYFYRRRVAETSAIQTSKRKKEWYLDTPDNVYQYLFDLSKEKFGSIIKYIQFLVMYDLQWRIKSPIPENVLTKKEEKEYLNKITNLVKQIDEDVIMLQKNMFIEHKLFTLNLKYDGKAENKFEIQNDKITINNQTIMDLSNNSILKINILNLNKDEIDIAGQVNNILSEENYKIYYKINDVEKELEQKSSKRYKKEFFDGSTKYNNVFRFNIKHKEKDITKIIFYLDYKGKKTILKPNFMMQGNLTNKLSLHHIKNQKMAYLKGSTIVIKKPDIRKRFLLESKYFLQLAKNRRLKQMIYRYTAKFLDIFKRKEIWLISDRTTVANDNGYHFFKYTVKQKDKKIKPYFVISKESNDYEKMSKIGRVVAHNSFKYRVLFLLADKIISSQADAWVINAFGKSEKYYRDMYRYDFVFLQHGITKNDQTAWLNFMNKNIKMMVTATQPEYNSFLEWDYGYTEKEIKLTGFPRYDNLKDQKKKQIAIMPTWRQSLAGKVNGASGTRDYNPEFKNSDYFKFYNELINDKRLLKIMEEKGYKGIFVIHPSHMENYIDFEENDIFEVVHGFADYQTIFRESSLLISDYSSVVFDFAYLYKPVIYTPFDKETFFKNHIYDEGYFIEERDGFGPVEKDYESAINSIIKCIENNCKIEDIYKKRIDTFYKYHDTNNCERVYKEIKKM